MDAPAKPGFRGMKGLKKQRRIQVILLTFLALIIAVSLIGYAMKDGINFFRSPSQVVSDPPGPSEIFRIGGLVETGSVRHEATGLAMRFVVTDGAHQVPVAYLGLPPDLFQEGSGVVAEGKLGADGTFIADNLLAKHDEKYVPREMKDMTAAQARQTVEETK